MHRRKQKEKYQRRQSRVSTSPRLTVTVIPGPVSDVSGPAPPVGVPELRGGEDGVRGGGVGVVVGVAPNARRRGVVFVQVHDVHTAA